MVVMFFSGTDTMCLLVKLAIALMVEVLPQPGAPWNRSVRKTSFSVPRLIPLEELKSLNYLRFLAEEQVLKGLAGVEVKLCESVRFESVVRAHPLHLLLGEAVVGEVLEAVSGVDPLLPVVDPGVQQVGQLVHGQGVRVDLDGVRLAGDLALALLGVFLDCGPVDLLAGQLGPQLGGEGQLWRRPQVLHLQGVLQEGGGEDEHG